MSNIKTYKVVAASFDDAEVNLQVDHDVLTPDLATLINTFWSGAEDRLAQENGDVVRAVVRLFGSCAISFFMSDGWRRHRPFTTLELACLQSFIDPEEYFAPTGPASRGERFVLDGESDQRWREAIGNAVPRKSAKAIGTVMGQTILLAKNGETFVLGSTPIWVRPMVAALAVAQEGGAA